MNELNKKAFGGLLFFIIALSLLLFIPVWTFAYWQAWVFLITLSICVFAITMYLAFYDPALLQRRVMAGAIAEKDKKQKLIQFIAQIAFALVIIIPSLDHRFSWSHVSTPISLIGDVLVVLGLLIVFFVFKANTFTSAIIEVDKKQQVVSEGPYAIVRHPMYAGAMLMLFGVPLALGSLWGLTAFLFITLVIIWRLLDEEKYLEKNLKGYREYENKVRYRLVPLLF